MENGSVITDLMFAMKFPEIFLGCSLLKVFKMKTAIISLSRFDFTTAKFSTFVFEDHPMWFVAFHD